MLNDGGLALFSIDDDARFAAHRVDHEAQVALDQALLHPRAHAHPEVQLELEGVVAEVVEEHDRLRRVQDAAMVLGGLLEELLHVTRGRAVRDAERSGRLRVA